MFRRFSRILRVYRWLAVKRLRSFFYRSVLLPRAHARGVTRTSVIQPPERGKRSQSLSVDALYEYARSLAAEHGVNAVVTVNRTLIRRFRENWLAIDNAHKVLEEAVKAKESLSPGAEWLLDNYHLVQQQIADIQRHFPRGYDDTLPKLISGELAGYPRVYQLALELLAHTDAVINHDLLTSFIRGYQSQTLLTMGELWAVPIMVRFALIENLAAIVERMAIAREERKRATVLVDHIIGDESKVGTEMVLSLSEKLTRHPQLLLSGAGYLISRLREVGRKASVALQWLEERLREEGVEPEEVIRNEQYFLAATQVSIGNTVNSLRAVNYIDWKDWFEAVNGVDGALRRDPLGCYSRGDFKTRDRYRHVIERLAKRARQGELVVAEQCVALAERELTRITADATIAPVERERHGHVGYYLVGAGLPQLEQALNYTPPLHSRLLREAQTNVFLLYTLSIIAMAAFLLFQSSLYTLSKSDPWLPILFVSLLFIVPAIDIATSLTQWVVSHLVPPDYLPKYDLSSGIPEEWRTVVVLQTLFTDLDAVDRTLEVLEVRFLANPDPQLSYGILADLADAPAAVMTTDDEIVTRARNMVAELNRRHGSGRFFVLFRRRLWNPGEGKYMGWERKRGKIEEFNRLLLGRGETTFLLDEEQRRILRGFRFVITLDNDSDLPRGVPQKLIGTLAHPLNRPRYDEGKGRVVEGYGIIQPRVGISLVSAHRSRFARTFSGHAGLDPYTQTVSEVYQDLFHESYFAGKAIYDLENFEVALRDRVPENALLSHDLFEGLFARVALATDVEIFDDFPTSYHVHARRQHRWVRGDWQLLPWVFRRVPNARQEITATPISSLGRWKIIDNLRRSLVAPSLFVLVTVAWAFLPLSSLYWSTLALLTIAFPVYLNLAQAFLIPPRGTSLASHVRGVGLDLVRQSKQAFFTICFLPHQAYLMLHAVVVTVWRLFVTRCHLLEWETAYHAERRLGLSIGSFYREMAGGVIVTAISLLTVATVNIYALVFLAPIYVLWLGAPLLARELSAPLADREYGVSPAESDYLHRVGYLHWRYFREFMNPENNYLVPDNLQLVPKRALVDRTSVTNISFSILAVMSAVDLGYMTLPQAIDLLGKVYATLGKLERFHGHFLNWYNTHTLAPLFPKYISMVDSGNLVGHLMAARVGYDDMAEAPLYSEAQRQHVVRQLLDWEKGAAEPALKRQLADLGAAFSEATSLRALAPLFTELDQLLVRLEHTVEAGGSAAQRARTTLTALYDVHLDRLWWGWIDACVGLTDGSLNALLDGPVPSLASAARCVETVIEDIEAAPALREALNGFLGVARDAETSLRDLAEQSGLIVAQVDFRFLYDEARDLFTIGYDVGNARRDNSYYDLLASEARLGSLVSIALGQVPQQHWFSLGRPLIDSPGGKVLLSWSGTMFEYLMPILVTKDFPATLLSESYRAAIRAQRSYCQKEGIPWGISESGYSGVDFEKTYQYRAFGVPGLGLKRGLEDDLVISPYSSFLALPLAYREALDNIRALERDGMLGEYGFYEAIDYTKMRLTGGETSHIVQSFLAHHQGMSLVSINNVLNHGVFQERFHRDLLIKATELLLHEKFPDRLPTLVPRNEQLFSPPRDAEEEEVSNAQVVTTPHTALPISHLLSNGRYALMIDNVGSGYSRVDRDTALTRWREDAVRNQLGNYVYLRDLETDSVWSTTYQPTRVEPEMYEVWFGPDKAEFKRKDHNIFAYTEITISPEEDVEIRRISLANLSSRRRVVDLTSYGEVVLGNVRADAAHPAFSKMFVQSEFLPDLDCLLFERRPRSRKEEPLYFAHMLTMKTVWDKMQFETSRTEFIGRGNTLAMPQAVLPGRKLSGGSGYVLDPIFSLRAKIELEPGQTEIVTFVNVFSKSRDEIIAIAQRYKHVHQVARAFEMAWSQSSVELRNERIATREAQVFQRLGNTLLFNVERFRAKTDVLARNHLPQSALWRFGISGDFPIVLLRITEANQLKLVQELLAAHNYLRMRGLNFDLVILNQYPGGYLQLLQDDIEFLVRASFSGGLIDKPGGIFLRTSIQLSEEETVLLNATARVVLSGLRGPLAAQLKFDDVVIAATTPGMKPPRAVGDALRSEPGTLLFYNGTGGFTSNGDGYQLNIRERLPPSPWSNVVANPKFGFLVTESGSGYTWAHNSREHRLTPWSNDPVIDPSGEVIYIRDSDSGSFWSPTPRPVRVAAEYRVEHYFGYSSFESVVSGVRSRLHVGVGADAPVKWWRLSLNNEGRGARKLELYFYVDWLLGIEREESYRHMRTAFDSQTQTLYAQNYWSNDFSGRMMFVGSNLSPDGFTTSRYEFLGSNGDLSMPRIFQLQESATGGMRRPERPQLSGRVGCGFDTCALLRVQVDLKPGAGEEVLFYLGDAANLSEIREHARSAAVPRSARDATDRYCNEIQGVTSAIEIRTPERSFDLLMNGWLLYQSLVCRVYGRTGFYQSGGAFGFRDQLQDVLALLHIRPDLVRAQILLHASRQFREGDVQHWWHPPVGKGVRTRISDDFLWLPYVTQRYLEVTGDHGILDEQVPFIEGPQLQEHEMELYTTVEQSTIRGLLYEHCILAIERGMHFGAHGLPLIGVGDWNDGMNEVGKGGKGESVWLAWFTIEVIQRFLPQVEQRDPPRAARYKETIIHLRDAVETSAWDGQWYRRAYFDDGTPLGSALNTECQIDSISQSWGIISRAGEQERVKLAMKEVEARLVNKKDNLIALLAPPFDKGDLQPGYIKGYLPGIRENGGQYSHAAVWVVIAAAMLGSGTQAYELFAMINPVNHTATPEGVARYRTEPYVMCGDVYSMPPHEGRGGWSWYTGSASWMYQAGLEYILGVRKVGTMLTINPCIPASWGRFSVRYRHGPTTFKISVENPERVERGVRSVTLDGAELADRRVPLDQKYERSTVEVVVTMGSAAT